MSNVKSEKRIRRHKRIRARVKGTADRPRLAVYKANTGLHAQLIDDVSEKTLFAVSDRHIKGENKTQRAQAAGKKIAEEAKKQGIEKVVFDRGGFIYTGRIQAFAEGAREAGLTF